MAAQGGLDADPTGEPVFLSVPVHDVVTPIVAAIGLVMALWQRDRTGAGQHVRTSLVQSTMVAQAAEYTRYRGRPPTARGGFDYPGPDGEHTWAEAGDGPVGLAGDELAAANGLTVACDHPEHGRLVVFGQLIGGAGPPPARAPLLDEHGAQILAELDTEEDIG
jgi:crotonobetainyl-CoA:carnitine CoA-transferase CaiB-like acyl-CoA transferase